MVELHRNLKHDPLRSEGGRRRRRRVGGWEAVGGWLQERQRLPVVLPNSISLLLALHPTRNCNIEITSES